MIDDPLQVATIFNDYFVDKIMALKNNIDDTMKEDPLSRLKEKMGKIKNKQSMSIKHVTQKEINKAFKKLKNKNSAGCDGIRNLDIEF